MPVKELIGESLVTADGEFCTLGVVGAARGMDIAAIDPDDRVAVAKSFGIPKALAAEIMYENDEGQCDHCWVERTLVGPVRPHWPEFGRHVTQVRLDHSNMPTLRWYHMRRWITSKIKPQPPLSSQA